MLMWSRLCESIIKQTHYRLQLYIVPYLEYENILLHLDQANIPNKDNSKVSMLPASPSQCLIQVVQCYVQSVQSHISSYPYNVFLVQQSLRKLSD